MRVAVFRALADGRRTARQLSERGHEAVLAPVIRIAPTGATVSSGTADGLVFTSAHAPETLFARPESIEHLRDLRCWCVGTRTAEAARKAGFTRINMGDGDARSLARSITDEGGGGRLTLVTGRERKPDLERELGRAGITLDVVTIYAAVATKAWTPTQVSELENAGAALHYSRRSADLAFELAEKHGLEPLFLSGTHICLSGDVADALRDRGVTSLEIAVRPTEECLLSLLPCAMPSFPGP